jgi:hypothetical protein
MAEGSAKKQDIQVTVGQDLSTATIQGIKVEVSPDSNVVVYTNDGVQTKPAATSAAVTEDTQISIGKDFNTVALYGAKVELGADGSLIVYTNGSVKIKPAPANDSTAASATPQIGDKMPAGHKQAGWIYAGISKTTHEPFYVAPKDSGVFQWKAAMDFAAKEGARVPSKEELDQMHDAMDKGALKGAFNVTGSYPAGWYWSSSQDGNDGAWAQRFSDGGQYDFYKYNVSSLRCVR